MKRSICLCALALCLLLCSCSAPPSAQPPAESRMTSSADILIRDGAVARKTIYTMVYGSKSTRIYLCKQENGVEETSIVDYDPFMLTATQLTYAAYQDLVAAVLDQINREHLGMSPTEHGEIDLQLMACSDGDNRSIAQRATDEPGSVFRYTGYYVYSISQQTMTPGDGTVMGSDAYGMLYVRNFDRYNLTIPPGEMERSYVLIAD